MAQFTVITNDKTNLPPYQTGVRTLNLPGGVFEYTFVLTDFTTSTLPPYADPEGDDLLKIKIINTGNNSGQFLYNGVVISINDEISATDINGGLLKYTTTNVSINLLPDSFNFDVADDGSGSYGGLIGTVNVFTNKEENLPPDEIGDGEETIEHGQTLIFTREMFTTETIPPYSDPEGDEAELLHIVTLPTDGKLFIELDEVYKNQVISFSRIDQGLLRYVPDSGILEQDIQEFEFGIADKGSLQFTY